MIVRRNLIATKHFAVAWGYNINLDVPFGLQVFLGRRLTPGNGEHRYRVVFGFCCDLPKLVWLDEIWAVNEPGYVRGMPVARRGIASSEWTGRRYHLAGIHWFRRWWFERHD